MDDDADVDVVGRTTKHITVPLNLLPVRTRVPPSASRATSTKTALSAATKPAIARLPRTTAASPVSALMAAEPEAISLAKTSAPYSELVSLRNAVCSMT